MRDRARQGCSGMRWIWIDRFVKFEHAESARAVRYLSLAEDFFEQHLPGYPIMPACFILEGSRKRAGFSSGRPTTTGKKSCWPRSRRPVYARGRRRRDLVVRRGDPDAASRGGSVAGKVYAIAPDSAPAGLLDRPSRKRRSFSPIWIVAVPAAFRRYNFVFSGELKQLLGLAKVMGQK